MTDIEMIRQVKFVIHYDGQIYNIEFLVVFIGAKSMELMFNSTIQMRELRTRIRRKVKRSSWGRIMRLQCRFLASIDPYKYDLFNVISKTHLETIISSHISSRNVVIKLYVEFINADGFGPSSTFVAANTGASQDYPRLDSDMIADIVLWMVKGIVAIRWSLGKEYSNGSFEPLSNVDRHFSTVNLWSILTASSLYGRYKQYLLLAISQDSNQKILPIAFAITPEETTDDWNCFLSLPQPNICVISNRGPGILSTIDHHRSL
ncbi:hypothetical protein J1N35_029207 [Gossypium stocksii]|uniref:Uncharacterized protein n=1 Tax=Gossypium stocksii TaxID=47602 RepID=A0A9D3UXU7_9ROSI|nr:hypothetical protein J1N35_029207 [Gossypium stocksii]